MKTLLNILHLEDDPMDALLIQSTLQASGMLCNINCVHNRLDFIAALEKGDVELILSDYSLPAFDGLSAAELVHARWPDIPLILVSGTLGEELAIDSLKKGATDYVLKERLGRLVPAIRRAMGEVEERGERKRLQAQFIEAQKMEVIGQLAGGVAHDFNNILAVIIGYCDFLATELGEASPLRRFTDEIRHASERAVGLTRQLLVFSRGQTVQPRVLDLNLVVKEMEPMLRRLINEEIEMNFKPAPDTGRIKADSGYVGQVLMNFVVNARDAIEKGGKITIFTQPVIVDAANAARHANIPPGHYALLGVSDTGQGMSDEVKLRLFEPFFTTKQAGKGTGLGLATCRNIAQQSGGYIAVESALNKGTTMSIYFPMVEAPLDAPSWTASAGPLPRGTETLLVVEDEPSVRHLAVGVLKSQGYAVLSASNGQEALQVTRDHRGPPIRLVVTDVIMPRMGGQVMAEWLKTAYPDLKILFTSGYTDEAIEQHGVFETGVEFLPKPYTPATLAHKVRNMLDG